MRKPFVFAAGFVIGMLSFFAASALSSSLSDAGHANGQNDWWLLSGRGECEKDTNYFRSPQALIDHLQQEGIFAHEQVIRNFLGGIKVVLVHTHTEHDGDGFFAYLPGKQACLDLKVRQERAGILAYQGEIN